MKLVFISDTHDRHNQVEIPECDVLVHAGDLTMSGSVIRVDETLEWLDDQPARHVICIGGNHDFFFQRHAEIVPELLKNYRIHYIEDNGVEIDGRLFWGSPYTPRFMDWAFMYDRPTPRWQNIPEDTNVLITHGPPVGILDRPTPGGDKLGCFDLRDAVLRVQPYIHAFGHIHGGYGRSSQNGTLFLNCSVVDEAYEVCNPPHVIEL